MGLSLSDFMKDKIQRHRRERTVDMFKIRGHTLLCLQGFRGKGYSEAFVLNMKRIHEALSNDHQTKVEVIIGPDDICSACPHLKDNLCIVNSPGSGSTMKKKDKEVIELIGIYPGSLYRWGDIRGMISERVTPEILKNLCIQCQWYSLGYCEEGISKVG